MSYGPLPAHGFDYYPPPAPNSHRPLLVFVHGGAWRSGDKADHAALARTLASLTACAVAVPNYQLTSQAHPLQHPSHAEDVLRCLHFLTTWAGPDPSSPQPPPSALYLLGHSCSAHMLASIFLRSPYAAELTPSRQLLAATRAILLSEGIYDIDALLRSFPNYKPWFIAPTFGDHDAYPEADVASYPLRTGAEHVRWLIMHSKGDELVDELQSSIMHTRLSTLTEGLPVGPRPLVEKNFHELEENHDDIFQGTVYPRIIADFVKRDQEDKSIPPAAAT